MLILTRRFGQRIMVNEGLIIIEIMRMNRDGSIAVGFIAPEEIKINREEVDNRIKQSSHINLVQRSVSGNANFDQ